MAKQMPEYVMVRPKDGDPSRDTEHIVWVPEGWESWNNAMEGGSLRPPMPMPQLMLCNRNTVGYQFVGWNDAMWPGVCGTCATKCLQAMAKAAHGGR